MMRSPAAIDHAVAHLLGHVEAGSRDWSCITASQLALSIFLNVMSRVMPALLTSTSTGPTSLTHLRDAGDARLPVGDVARVGVELEALPLHRRKPFVRPWCCPASGW